MITATAGAAIPAKAMEISQSGGLAPVTEQTASTAITPRADRTATESLRVIQKGTGAEESILRRSASAGVAGGLCREAVQPR